MPERSIDDRIRAAHLLDVLDVAEECLGPQCGTVSAAGVRCVLDLNHEGVCDVRPWRDVAPYRRDRR